MKKKDVMMSIDPGLETGYAVWEIGTGKKEPIMTGVIKPHHSFSESWIHQSSSSAQGLRYFVDHLSKTHTICTTVIENAAFFMDGGMLTGSAYMREPWGVSEVYSITDPAYRGLRI